MRGAHLSSELSFFIAKEVKHSKGSLNTQQKRLRLGAFFV
jgi:hypothetical protein